jgi:hypothetical protein
MKRTITVLFRISVICLILIPSLAFAAHPDKGQKSKKKVKPSGIWGRVVMRDAGEKVKGAYVYGYQGKIEHRAASLGIIGVTDWVSRGSDEEGSYKLDLPPGDYFVVARKRQSGLNYGPLSVGDFYDHSPGRVSTRVRKGKYTEVNFVLMELTEPLFFQGMTAVSRATGTGIKGRLLDEEGNHIPGSYAIAYKDDDMQRLPDFASTLTDDEGNFAIYLPSGGRYWIAARFHAMKVPVQGEPFGRYEGTDDHSVNVEEGVFLEGIDITLRPFDGEPPEGYHPVH